MMHASSLGATPSIPPRVCVNPCPRSWCLLRHRHPIHGADMRYTICDVRYAIRHPLIPLWVLRRSSLLTLLRRCADAMVCGLELRTQNLHSEHLAHDSTHRFVQGSNGEHTRSLDASTGHAKHASTRHDASVATVQRTTSARAPAPSAVPARRRRRPREPLDIPAQTCSTSHASAALVVNLVAVHSSQILLLPWRRSIWMRRQTYPSDPDAHTSASFTLLGPRPWTLRLPSQLPCPFLRGLAAMSILSSSVSRSTSNPLHDVLCDMRYAMYDPV
ncbi:hypothetical protein C8R45DRAFT_186214 [Mycena sanguinolenta]|nr:hypothetical protein C8R45DRAFT_186214 [Mycena sanguinolenta]